MTSTPLPKDDPLLLAWEAHKATADYANSRHWAQRPEHVDGSLWALFLAGWAAAHAFQQDKQQTAIRLQYDQTGAPTGEPQIKARAALAEPVADEPVAFADCVAFESAMGAGKGCDVWPKAGDYTQRTGRQLIALYTRPAAAPAERGEYPPLPEPAQGEQSEGYMSGCPDLIPATPDFYTADQMRAYVDADRAQRVPLTDEQIDEIVCANAGYGRDDFRSCVRAIERAHGIGAKP